MRKKASFLFTALSFFAISCASSYGASLSEVHYTMGTLLEITIGHENAAEGKNIMRRAFREVRRLEDIFTDYDPDGPLSQLNRQAGLGPAVIRPELYEIIELSLKLSAATHGAFDITLGPLLDLWRLAQENGRWPQPGQISRALQYSGWKRVKLLKGSKAELLNKGMGLDLGGIGKGYAVDRVVEIFKSEGVENAFINFGGSSIYALGGPSSRKPWVVWVAGPDRKSIVAFLELNNMALSASGSFGRPLSIGGISFGHIIDPSTGLPLTENFGAVAIAKTASEAEAFSKALLISKSRGGFEKSHIYGSIAGLVISPENEVTQTPALRNMGIFKLLDEPAEIGQR